MHIYKKKHLFILTGSWLLVNLFVYMILGVKYAIDTVRFDNEASSWLSGTFEFSYHFWYSGYIAILAVCKMLFHSIYPSIVIQCCISLLSIVLFYIGLNRILKNKWIAFTAALLIILYIPIQQWNVCLLTESFYISSILLFIWMYSFENNLYKWTGLFIIALFTSTLRPNGGILLITLSILAAKHVISGKNRTYLYAFSVCIISGLLFLLNTATDVFYQFLIDSFNKGEVICGYSGWNVPMKSPSVLNDSNGSIIKIGKLFLKHPIEYVQLAMYRLVALWVDVRPYYSGLHNAYIILFLSLTYFFAGIGIFRFRKKYSTLFLITVVYAGFNSVLVMITYADWDGRFLAPLLPIIFFWSALGIHYIISTKNNDCHKPSIR